jgi:soluble epoxide hydrolase/lipid-phosphate phosphatase
MIVPDMLGYGGTSKPLHTKAYSGKSMAQDIYEILEHEKIDSALGVGHDW